MKGRCNMQITVVKDRKKSNRAYELPLKYRIEQALKQQPKQNVGKTWAKNRMAELKLKAKR